MLVARTFLDNTGGKGKRQFFCSFELASFHTPFLFSGQRAETPRRLCLPSSTILRAGVRKSQRLKNGGQEVKKPLVSSGSGGQSAKRRSATFLEGFSARKHKPTVTSSGKYFGKPTEGRCPILNLIYTTITRRLLERALNICV